MTAAIVFACSFGVVLALGLQQMNVSGGHRTLAALTSVVIGLCNLGLLKAIPQPTEVVDIAAFLSGGPFGILTAMQLHPHLVRWFSRGKT